MGYQQEGEGSLLSYVKRSLSFRQEEAQLPGLEDRPRGSRSWPCSPVKSPLKVLSGRSSATASEEDAQGAAPPLSCPPLPYGCPGELDEAEDPYDVADQLERGLTKSIDLSSLRIPVVPQKQLLRHCIFHLADPVDEYQLVSESGDLILTAKFDRKDHRFDFFASEPHPEKANLPTASARPAFTMSYSDGAHEWILAQSKCERCTHRPKHLTCEYLGKGQQVARIKYSRRPVGPPGGQKIFVHHVEVNVPPVEASGESAAWCPAEMGRDLGASEKLGYRRCRPATASPASRAWARSTSERERNDPSYLHSKLPAWDEELECLVLNFKSRQVESSPHNFMLCNEILEDCVSTSASSASSRGSPDSPDQSPSCDSKSDESSLSPATRAGAHRKARGASEKDAVIFQHAKMSGNTYCCDFGHPLSPVQAFAVAMASLTWT